MENKDAVNSQKVKIINELEKMKREWFNELDKLIENWNTVSKI